MRTTFCVAFLASALGAFAAEPHVGFLASADSVACYDFVEVTLTVSPSGARNPFTDVTVEGSFGVQGENPVVVDGFCDSPDGSVFRIRFMPARPGAYDYTVNYREGAFARIHRGRFQATDQRKRGILRVDPEFPSHFQWEGSQERFFVNAVTAPAFASSPADEACEALDRLDRFKVTRIHAVLDAPGQAECNQDAGSCPEAQAPWVTQECASYDFSRFDPAYWQKLDRIVAFARNRDMVIALSLPPSGPDAPAGAEADRLLRYAAARLAACSNVVWEFQVGAAQRTLLAQSDPYGHVVLDSAPAEANAAGASPESAARIAWETCLGGGYPTLSQALGGDAAGALELGGNLYDFFTGITWWKLKPESSLVVALQPHPSARETTPRALAARNADGDLAVVYVQGGGIVTLRDELLKDQLKPLWFSPRDGGMRNARALRSRVYRTPTADDWVLLFRTPCNCSFRDFDNEFED